MWDRSDTFGTPEHSYIPDNFESMSRDELMKDIRAYVKEKRKNWEAKY